MSSIGYLIDMDGVIYREGETIPGATEFINPLSQRNIPFMFLTNNSQRTRRDIVTKLRRLGFRVEEGNIFTRAMATARFPAAQKPGGTAYAIGEGGLLNALHENGYSVVDSPPDYVVVGEGSTISFEMIEHATTMLVNGAKLVATNLDPNCPTSRGVRPGCGTITALPEKAPGVQAFSVGKPSPLMMRAARKEPGLDASRTVMVGDTMETDILGGVNMGYRTALVLTGGSKRSDLDRHAHQPDRVVESIADLPDPGHAGGLEAAQGLPGWDAAPEKGRTRNGSRVRPGARHDRRAVFTAARGKSPGEAPFRPRRGTGR